MRALPDIRFVTTNGTVTLGRPKKTNLESLTSLMCPVRAIYRRRFKKIWPNVLGVRRGDTWRVFYFLLPS